LLAKEGAKKILLTGLPEQHHRFSGGLTWRRPQVKSCTWFKVFARALSTPPTLTSSLRRHRVFASFHRCYPANYIAQMALDKGDSEQVSSMKRTGMPGSETNLHAPTSGAIDGNSLENGDSGLESDSIKTSEAVNDTILQLTAQGDTNESYAEILEKVKTTPWPSLAEELFRKERKEGDLALRSKQAVLHLTWTEMRISLLETELQNLQSEIRDLPNDFKVSPRKQKCLVHKFVLKRSTIDEFRTTPYSKDLPTQERPALEVLVIDYLPPLETGTKDEFQMQSRRSTGLLGFDNNPVGTQQVPERLRIRSLPLIAHLEKICRETLTDACCWRVSISTEAAPVVLLRPFKLLIHYEEEIRRSVQEVHALLRANEGVETAMKGDCKGIEFEYKDLYQALKLLIEFLDIDLKPTLDLRQNIRDGTATLIEYADLWHLFKLGDIVLSRLNRSQAFKVVNIAGGRDKLGPLLRNPEEKPKKPKPVLGFTVDCCSICFDGTEYVPKLERFSIRKFAGPRLITSLQVYPLRFEDVPKAAEEAFLTQGRQYLELTRSPFTHRAFKGKTLDEPPQELDAQVIVDATLAVNTNAEWRLTGRVTEEDLCGDELRETHMAPFCEHGSRQEGCCGSDYIFKDLNMNRSKLDPFREDHGGLFGPRSAREVETDCMLLPNWVYAFALRSRQWVTIKMADLSEVQFENDFDELMFSESHKRTILALVETHENEITTPDTRNSTVGAVLDLVRGKGTGLIILLHGEPGR
jgi:hypothetical protein